MPSEAERVAELERQLIQLEKERDAWRREFNLYRTAWLREIGGTIHRKAHEIDGFVLRTREIYEKSCKLDKQTPFPASHDDAVRLVNDTLLSLSSGDDKGRAIIAALAEKELLG